MRSSRWAHAVLCAAVVAACTGPASSPELRDGRPDIAHAAPGDDELAAATATARARLHGFEQALDARRAGCVRHAVKVRVGPTPAGEQLWLVEPVRVDGGFRGVVDNTARTLPDLHRGDRITVPLRGVTDWMMVCDGALVGGESLRLALRRAWPWQRGAWREAAGFRIE